MLKFDEKGNLKPYGIIQSSLEEVKAHFVDNIGSETRKVNFEKYLHYSSELKKHSGGTNLKQWIDGSFVTRKINPNDIDIVTFLDQIQIGKLGKLIENFKLQNGTLLYGVDAYIVELHHPNDKRFSITKWDTAYWQELFLKTRGNRTGRKSRKGYLEIFY